MKNLFQVILSVFAFFSVAVALPVLTRPVATSESAENKEDRVPLVILDHSHFTLSGQRFSSFGELGRELKELAKKNPRLAVLIVPGNNPSFGVTVRVLDECRKAGVSDIKVDGAESRKEPNQSLQRNAGSRPFCGSALSSAWLI